MSPQVGRPKVDNPKVKSIKVRFDEKLYSKIVIYAKKNNMTKTEVIRKGVIKLLES